MSKRILTTGGAGFIGSHLTDELLQAGYQVRVLGDLLTQVHGPTDGPPLYLSRDVEFRKGDVRDRHSVRDALQCVDAVFHLSAAVGVGQSMYEVEHYTSVNALGTAVLLEAIIDYPVQKLVAASSMSIYGEGRQVRDVLYIDDLIDALLLALENIDLVVGQALNVGGGPENTVSVLQAVRYLSELAEVSPQTHYGPWRKGDQRYYVSDTRRFRALTGWTPQTPVEQGMSRLCRWLLEQAPLGVLQVTE